MGLMLGTWCLDENVANGVVVVSRADIRGIIRRVLRRVSLFTLLARSQLCIVRRGQVMGFLI